MHSGMQSRRNFGIALAIVAGVALTPSIAFAGSAARGAQLTRISQ
jgi:hypothetical protein